MALQTASTAALMKLVTIVFGGGFGDEAKGETVAEIARVTRASLTARFNGGATAGHKVYVKYRNGKIIGHEFQQFGSGTLEGCETYLSKYFRFSPYNFIGEWGELKEIGFRDDVSQRVMLDERAVITTPYHAAYSKMMGPIHNRGTCGIGAGESWRYSLVHPESTIYGADLKDETLMRQKLAMQSLHYREAASRNETCNRANSIEVIADMFAWTGSLLRIVGESDWLTMREKHQSIVLEGSQGYWISINSPFAPYVTSSDTSPKQALEMLDGYDGKVDTVMCMNMVSSRHGPGPLPTEDKALDAVFKPYAHEGQWNGISRYGWFDSYLTKKTIQEVGGITYFAVSHLDCFDKLPRWRIALNYRNKKSKPVYRSFKRLDSYMRCIEEQVGHRINIGGYNTYEREFISYP